MKEISDIITSYNNALHAGKACALATVVHVQGSSYRRPGARMLVTDDGILTGAISGGCLEGDALRKALLAINEGKNKLVTYDTTDEDDAKFGVQLGCNGIVHILFEPIDHTLPNHPIALLKKAFDSPNNIGFVTLFSIEKHTLQIGSSFFCDEKGDGFAAYVVNTFSSKLHERLQTDAIAVVKNGVDTFKEYERNENKLHAFIQFIAPPISIVIVGAGNDAMPLTIVTNLLGWKTILIDGRYTHATTQRFPLVNKIIVAKPAVALNSIEISRRTVVVLMTHNYNYDLAILKQLLTKPVQYIGILGPKSKMQRMYDEMEDEGIFVTEVQKEKIYSPMGLDIGAETSEEIALSIVTEIKAVFTGKNAQMLRLKQSPVHF